MDPRRASPRGQGPWRKQFQAVQRSIDGYHQQQILKDVEGVALMKLKRMGALRGRREKERLSFLAQGKAVHHQGGTNSRAEFSLGCTVSSHFISSIVVCVIESESVVPGRGWGGVQVVFLKLLS